MRRHGKVHRLNLELGPQTYKALQRLQAAVEASSQAEAIRISLQTMAKVVEELRGGAKLIIKREGEEPIEIVLPLAGK